MKISESKTVDDLVESLKSTSNFSHELLYGHVITVWSDILLKLLRSTDNIPSKYDLLLIDAINKFPFVKTVLHVEIIKLYKERKYE